MSSSQTHGCFYLRDHCQADSMDYFLWTPKSDTHVQRCPSVPEDVSSLRPSTATSWKPKRNGEPDFRHEPSSIVSPDSCLGLPTSSAALHPAAVAASVTRVQSVGTARSLGQFVSCRNEFTSDTRSFCIFYSLKRWDNCLSAS